MREDRRGCVHGVFSDRRRPRPKSAPSRALAMHKALAVVVLLALPAATSTYTASSSSTPLGINMHTHATPEQLLPVVAAGISIVRTDIGWAGIETTRGRYNFTGTDSYIAALKGARLRLLAIMDAGGHPLYDSGRPPASAAAVQAYGWYVGNFTAHYATETASAQILLEITNGA